jgi:hypothetical protein
VDFSVIRKLLETNTIMTRYGHYVYKIEKLGSTYCCTKQHSTRLQDSQTIEGSLEDIIIGLEQGEPYFYRYLYLNFPLVEEGE